VIALCEKWGNVHKKAGRILSTIKGSPQLLYKHLILKTVLIINHQTINRQAKM